MSPNQPGLKSSTSLLQSTPQLLFHYHPIELMLNEKNSLAALEETTWRILSQSLSSKTCCFCLYVSRGRKKHESTTWIKIKYSFNSSLSHHDKSMSMTRAPSRLVSKFPLLWNSPGRENFRTFTHSKDMTNMNNLMWRRTQRLRWVLIWSLGHLCLLAHTVLEILSLLEMDNCWCWQLELIIKKLHTHPRLHTDTYYTSFSLRVINLALKTSH